MAAKKDNPETEAQKAAAAKARQETLEPVSVRTKGAARFARAGRIFGREPKLISNYTKDQLKAWQDEPLLIVE